MVRVVPPNVESFLVRWLRAELAARPEPVCQGVRINRVEPDASADEPFPEKLIVVRDDSGPSTSVISREVSVGVSVLAGTKENPQDAMDLANIVYALIRDCAAVEPGNPVAAVLEGGSFGPYLVPEDQPRARSYQTHTMSVVGTAL